MGLRQRRRPPRPRRPTLRLVSLETSQGDSSAEAQVPALLVKAAQLPNVAVRVTTVSGFEALALSHPAPMASAVEAVAKTVLGRMGGAQRPSRGAASPNSQCCDGSCEPDVICACWLSASSCAWCSAASISASVGRSTCSPK